MDRTAPLGCRPDFPSGLRRSVAIAPAVTVPIPAAIAVVAVITVTVVAVVAIVVTAVVTWIVVAGHAASVAIAAHSRGLAVLLPVTMGPAVRRTTALGGAVVDRAAITITTGDEAFVAVAVIRITAAEDHIGDIHDHAGKVVAALRLGRCGENRHAEAGD